MSKKTEKCGLTLDEARINLMATRAARCVTHHEACDCMEYRSARVFLDVINFLDDIEECMPARLVKRATALRRAAKRIIHGPAPRRVDKR